MNFKFIFSALLCFSALFSCKTADAQSIKEVTDNQVAECTSCDLIGEISRAQLVDNPIFNEWFSESYENYELHSDAMKTLNDVSTENLSFKIILGTWCSDSHRDVPRFVKILDFLNIDDKSIEYYALDAEKMSPEKIEETYSVIQVPTFIVYKKDVELNRIVEMSIRTLEEDLAIILTTNDYKNVYAD
ncbi:thioredoxin domain-containing protein [Bizionia myxarmorum]|uniref:Thioredoxin family protein n=1 Tax=Bizionia myxarmorum TaxID=291186 RepID=A0A5D0R4F8_9FLAO|nr:hypothetical protein [Bizionia myxarmorum]TYB76353.1 hypothetical protein ES674_12245 [Bizionia myxarmorum]